MAGREIMEINGHDGVDQTGETVETVIGAGRVGIIATSYEERHQRMLVAGPETGAVAFGRPQDMLVSRERGCLRGCRIWSIELHRQLQARLLR